MVYAPDTPTWRVYSAEQSLPGGRWFPSIDQAAAYAHDVLTSPWWRRRFPHIEQVDVIEGGLTSDNGELFTSFAQPGDDVTASTWTISLHPQMLLELVVLHELAHCASPRWEADVAALRRGEVRLARTHHHGRLFAATMSELVGEFASTGPHELADAYGHFEVALAATDDLAQVRADLPEVEAFVQSLKADLSTGGDDRAPPDAARSRDWVPAWTWGECLLIPRRFRLRPMISQQTLAERITVVERCSRRDISRIERADTRPTNPRDLRIAMAMAACLGLDPIYARHGLGLVRWDCGIDLDELRQIAPGWVDLVEHLNVLTTARPPRWAVPGDR